MLPSKAMSARMTSEGVQGSADTLVHRDPSLLMMLFLSCLRQQGLQAIQLTGLKKLLSLQTDF